MRNGVLATVQPNECAHGKNPSLICNLAPGKYNDIAISTQLQGELHFMRKTRQAETINAVLDSHPAPLTAFELHAKAKIRSPKLGIATVYRHLGQMLRRDQLVQVELAGQPCRYERAGKAHHHHFLCGNCGRIFELPGCVAGLNKFVPEGFHALKHELTVFGACRDCASTRCQ